MRRRELIALIGCSAAWPLPRAQSAARTDPSDNRDGSASSEWVIGPIINGRQYSVGMPTSPTPDGEGFWFDFPKAQKGLDRWSTPGPHYVTRPTSGISGSKIKLAYEITGDGQFFGSTGQQSSFVYLCAFFQRSGDNWSGADAFEAHRWWSATMFPLKVGKHEVEVPLAREDWVSVYNRGTEAQFADALRKASSIGVTFGNDEGRGHGVSSPTGGSSFRLISFEVV
jgi:hypothetical protein